MDQWMTWRRQHPSSALILALLTLALAVPAIATDEDESSGWRPSRVLWRWGFQG